MTPPPPSHTITRRPRSTKLFFISAHKIVDPATPSKIKIPPIAGVPSFSLCRVYSPGHSFFLTVSPTLRDFNFFIMGGAKITVIKNAVTLENTILEVIYLNTLKKKKYSLKGYNK